MFRPIPELSESDKARFWAKVDVRDLNECWPWQRSMARKGYGQFWLAGKNHSAHRIALALKAVAFSNPEAHALHSCDNPPCCNPAHLRWGSMQDNSADMVARGRSPTGEKSGRYTHPETTARGEKNGRVKLTEEDVRRIRASKEKQRTVAAYYGVAHSQIGRIRRRNIWKHVL